VETFVVRIATPAPGAMDAASRELHGVVEQLRSKRSQPFRGNDELLRLLSASGIHTGRVRSQRGKLKLAALAAAPETAPSDGDATGEATARRNR
jgi:hypothetical protein